jgi:hypothetical protein
MKRNLLLWVVVIAAGIAAAQESRQMVGAPPATPLKGQIHAIADPAPLRSFRDLCEHADLIVEGVVETLASRRMPGIHGNIETDYWVAVKRVIKGPPETRKLATSELGGTFGELQVVMNYPLMQRGERYVLFLYTDTYADRRPQIPGLARYRDDVFYGRYLVDNGKVRLNLPASDNKKYDGMTVDAFAAEIAA